MVPRLPFRLAALAAASLALVVHAQCAKHDDFITRSDPLLAPVQPADCSTVTQTPPDFTWPPYDGIASYTLSLRFPDGHVETRASTRNFVIWPRALPPGKYTWTLKGAGRSDPQGEARTFVVREGASEFIVPTGEAALEQARKAPRPRSWPADAKSPTRGAEREGGVRDLVAIVEQSIREPLPPEPTTRSKDENYDLVVAETKRATASALAWALTRRTALRADATRRLLNLASWNPRGPIGYASNDMASRTLAWTLALAFDWMRDDLDPAQRSAILAAIKGHAQPMFEDIAPRISKYPYDSHGNVTLTLTAAIGALMAGEIPEADEWLRSTISLAIVWTSPWGSHDGGFGNGTAQLYWDTGSNLPAWYIFRNAAGVDLAKREWVANLGRAMAYFVPPGTPAGLFGDGQELNLQELWARVGKGYSRFAPSPVARWYASQMKGEDASRMELLLAPAGDKGTGSLPAGIEDAAFFPSIGWVAMHSSLADPRRTSVYFKSSPYGSYNHSHADQNSFVVNDQGKRLAIASGYYDGYRTAHWTNWYKQTRSANAITFDGGHGQGIDGRNFSGTVTRFVHTRDFDYAVGHAEKAFAPALGLAQRSIAYLRPSTIVVYDALASDTARTWEWNLHALNRMTKHADNRVSIANEGATLCVEMLAGPPLEFTQGDRFTAPPEGTRWKNEWHGTFAATRKSQRAEFVALLRVGADCSRASGAAATQVRNGWQVAVDGRTVTFSGDDVSLK